LGAKILDAALEQLGSLAKVETQARLEGRNMTMVLSPDKKPVVLRRMVKTLMENDKQRALVLDERMSPFFSTVLYMEMPHELITTSV
jgi:hypothetical protein